MEPTLITQTKPKSPALRGLSFIIPSLGSSVCLFHWAAPNNPLSQLLQSPQGKAKGFLKWNIQWLWEGSGRGKHIFPADKAKHLSLREPLHLCMLGRAPWEAREGMHKFPSFPNKSIPGLTHKVTSGGGSWRSIKYGPRVQRCSWICCLPSLFSLQENLFSRISR